MKSLEKIAKEAEIKLTPELRYFAWLVNHYTLLDFWESAKKQIEFQQEVLNKAKEKNRA